MKRLLYINAFIFIGNFLYAQYQDDIMKDTLVNAKLFQVIMYDDNHHPLCVGHFLPGSHIRNGEWDYFFNDGKIQSQTFFNSDDKTGIWIYYDESGNIIKEIKPCKKHHSFIDYYCNKDDDDAIMQSVYQNAQQNKNACIFYSHGSDPIEYDEDLYHRKVKMMMDNMCFMQGDNSYIYKNIPFLYKKPPK